MPCEEAAGGKMNHPTMLEQVECCATKLHEYIVHEFEQNGALLGPDPGIRLNYRIGRFIKGYSPWIPWKDSLYYLQGQGYWVMANWQLSTQTGDPYANLALDATAQIISHQRSDGAWEYPNPEWKGRVATVEGTFASFALLESFRRTGDQKFLDSALNWYQYFIKNVGFQNYNGTRAVNYFAGRAGNPVPNNSSLILRYLADLSRTTNDESIREPCEDVVSFLRKVQQPSGELPYVVDEPKMLHFQCFQYHSFIYLDTWNYYHMTGDSRVLDLIAGILRFLSSGLDETGYCFYQCSHEYRTVNYHTVAIATALSMSKDIGLDSVQVDVYQALAQRALTYVLNQQASDGSFPHSRGDYRILCDHRKYPRYLAIMHYHLRCICSALSQVALGINGQ